MEKLYLDFKNALKFTCKSLMDNFMLIMILILISLPFKYFIYRVSNNSIESSSITFFVFIICSFIALLLDSGAYFIFIKRSLAKLSGSSFSFRNISILDYFKYLVSIFIIILLSMVAIVIFITVSYIMFKSLLYRLPNGIMGMVSSWQKFVTISSLMLSGLILLGLILYVYIREILSYSLAPYVIADSREDINISKSFSLSRMISRGHKLKLLFSFVICSIIISIVNYMTSIINYTVIWYILVSILAPMMAFFIAYVYNELYLNYQLRKVER